MNKKIKRVIIICGVIILTLHFSLILFYSLRPNKYSSFYTYPYFHQNWNLFVPPPDSNYHLYATFEDKGTQTIDIFRELLNKHQGNRTGGSELLMIALCNSIHYFEKEKEPGQITDKQEGTKFSLIEKFAKHYIEDSRHIKTDKMRLILLVTQTTSNKIKVYYN